MQPHRSLMEDTENSLMPEVVTEYALHEQSDIEGPERHNKRNKKRSGARRQKVMNVRTLLGGHEALYIQHGSRRYLLRITRNNNLILTRDEADRAV